MADEWNDGAGYDSYVGRWSRRVAREFLRWLAVQPGSAWLDFGCGTGALSQTILSDGTIRLGARAWAVKGMPPDKRKKPAVRPSIQD